MDTGTISTGGKATERQRSFSTGLAAPGQDSCQCLLVRVGSTQLLVPRILVVEVVGGEQFDIRPAPDGSLVTLTWRGHQVPLLSPAVLQADSADLSSAGLPGAQGKIVVFHGLLDKARLPYYALAVDSNPKLLEVSADTLREDESAAPGPMQLMRVLLGDSSAFIPRVDHLERHLHAALTTSPAEVPTEGLEADLSDGLEQASARLSRLPADA